MEKWIDYLSGNVPGGIFLYLLLVIVTFFVLMFMYRVNELFTRKHFTRWFILSFLLYSGIYIFLWFQNPPHYVYKRYSVGILRSDTEDNWLGEYFTDIISKMVKPYQSKRKYFFPYSWLYRVTPSDSVANPQFVEHIYTEMPVHTVLTGSVKKNIQSFEIDLQLRRYPGGKILKEAKGNFPFQKLNEFAVWIKQNFGSEISFKNAGQYLPYHSDTKQFVLAKRHYFKKQYQQSSALLKQLLKEFPENQYFQLWNNYVSIKLAARERPKSSSSNFYKQITPSWLKKIKETRQFLLKYLREHQAHLLSNVAMAETYIWEEDFGSAEIFLKRAYIENPFHVDILFNLSFLHQSRYEEFGFSDAREIYKRILTYCPIVESVLVKWSELMLEGKPGHVPQPKIARKYAERYLKINPLSHKIWLLLGEIESRLMNRQDALTVYQKADSLKPKDGLIHYNIGVLYHEWEQYDKAEKYFKQSIEYGDYLDSHIYLGEIYKMRGNYKKALAEFRYRVAYKQGEDDFYAYQAMKGIQECLEALEKSDQH